MKRERNEALAAGSGIAVARITVAATLLIAAVACGEAAAPSVAAAVPASREPPLSTAAQLEFVDTIRRETAQFGNLLDGGFEVAQEAGSPLAMHVRLTNISAQQLEYPAFYGCTDPQFSAAHLVGDRWRPIPLGYCGTYMQVCSLAPSESRDLYLPLPALDERVRFAVPVKSAAEPAFGAVVVVERPSSP